MKSATGIRQRFALAFACELSARTGPSPAQLRPIWIRVVLVPGAVIEADPHCRRHLRGGCGDMVQAYRRADEDGDGVRREVVRRSKSQVGKFKEEIGC